MHIIRLLSSGNDTQMFSSFYKFSILNHLTLPLVFLAFFVGSSYAQDLSYSDRGNRFEGHRRTEAGAPALEAMSFIRGDNLSLQNAPTSLTIEFYLAQPEPIYIEARELVPVHFYEMTVKRTEWPPGQSTFGPWQTSEVIDKLKVPLSNIGVIAKIGSNRLQGGGEIAALSFSQESLRSNNYEFVFRVKYDVKKASYRVEHIDSRKLVAGGSQMQITGGAPASIVVDLANAQEGKYR